MSAAGTPRGLISLCFLSNRRRHTRWSPTALTAHTAAAFARPRRAPTAQLILVGYGQTDED
jgi:hypothetical protein